LAKKHTAGHQLAWGTSLHGAPLKGVIPESYLMIFDLAKHINLQTHNVKVEAVGLFAKKQMHSCRVQ
jgi:hypothetical protein